MLHLKEALPLMCSLLMVCYSRPLEEHVKKQSLSFCNLYNIFKCSSGLCIPDQWKCDGSNDCPDGDDEKNCENIETTLNPKCRPDQFYCASDNACIPSSWQCNGGEECSQGEDEMGCPFSSTIKPKVTTAKLVSEVTSPTGSQCLANRRYCASNNICIPKSWYCDGTIDCLQGEDELDCPTNAPGTSVTPTRSPTERVTSERTIKLTTDITSPSGGSPCRTDQFYCNKNNICIPKGWLCDGARDCSDGEDEHGCETTTALVTEQTMQNITVSTTEVTNSATSPDSRCSSTDFYCRYNKICIPKSWHCDGTRDCSQGEDELDCPTKSRGTSVPPTRSPTERVTSERTTKLTTDITSPSGGSPCRTDQFYCNKNNLCIPKGWLCDGERDCSEGEDELGCESTTALVTEQINQNITDSTTEVTSSTGSKCTAVQFYCQRSNQCIPMSWHCDTKDDCLWGEDEDGCRETTMSGPISTTTKGTTKSTTEVTSPSGLKCGAEQFHCKINNLCLPGSWRCDGMADCLNGEDELNCQAVKNSTSMPSNNLTNESTTEKATTRSTAATSPDSRCSSTEFYCQYNKICIPKSWHCDGTRDCSQGEDELDCPTNAPRTSVPPTRSPTERVTSERTTKLTTDITSPIVGRCSSDEFYCYLSNKCIPKGWRCDGARDCNYGEDERDCHHPVTPTPQPTTGGTTPACSDRQFMCLDGRCISQRWVCDGEADCSEGEEETNCKQTCGSEQFQCLAGNCIPAVWACDEQEDCVNGDDEANCTDEVTCYESQFMCKIDKQCIQSMWVCDGSADCRDGSDESDCNKTTCGSDQMMCTSNWRCIPLQWQCDGDKDCSEGEDEVNCSMKTSAPRNVTCPPLQFKCEEDQRCIDISWICDSENDCSQGSDEVNCPSATMSTSTKSTKSPAPSTTIKTSPNTTSASATTVPGCNGFLCVSTGTCIPMSFKCDGFHDCKNSEDELGCRKDTSTTTSPNMTTMSPTCGNGKFQCFSGECIAASLVCNDKTDCPQGEDENNCTVQTTTATSFTTPNSRCNPSYAYCPRSDLCIPKSWVCDGSRDCLLGEDEENCKASLSSTQITPTQSTVLHCAGDEYQCEPTQCIPRSKLCDGKYDCANGADEMQSQCPTTGLPTTIPTSTQAVRCGKDEFQCEQTQCIPKSKLCDGKYDCANGADEIPFYCGTTTTTTTSRNPTCQGDLFRCVTGQCISKEWLCDSENDCPGGEDEKNCGGITCPGNTFQCSNERCIPNNWVCDNEFDCQGGEDEENCTESTCNPGYFMCNSTKQCIPEMWRCDNERDCPLGEDEANCGIAQSSTERPSISTNKIVSPTGSTLTCHGNTFRCGDGKCIPRSWLCDHDSDCSDSTDEINCDQTTTSTQRWTTTTYLPTRTSTVAHTSSSPYRTTSFSENCGDGQFNCGDGKCIPSSWKCDGDRDCSSGRDEQGCTQSSTTAPGSTSSKTPACSRGDFKCGNGACIPIFMVCDGIRQCPNGEDESRCPTTIPLSTVTSGRCSHSQFDCGNNICVPLFWKCDGQVDCPSGADEANCGIAQSSTERPSISTKKIVSPTGSALTCHGNTFRCGDGKCIPRSWLCDQDSDCSDSTDEINCDQTTTPTQRWTTTTNFPTRTSTIQPTPSTKCQSDQFSCGNDICIPASWQCDGQADCPSLLDEEGCSDEDESEENESGKVNEADGNDRFWWLPRGYPFGNNDIKQ